MSKTRIERIESLESKIQQLENERKRLLSLHREADRKARTKRLIERGAILESLISDPATFTNEQIKAFLEKTITNANALKILEKLSTEIKTPPVDSQWKVKSTSTPSDEKTAQATEGMG